MTEPLKIADPVAEKNGDGRRYRVSGVTRGPNGELLYSLVPEDDRYRTPAAKQLPRESLLASGDAYFTSDGRQHPPMSYAQALKTVLELASRNAVDELDVAFGDEGMEDEKAWTTFALGAMERALEVIPQLDPGHPGLFAGEWPSSQMNNPDFDPTTPSVAVATCAAMAANIIDTIDDPKEAAKANQAVEMTFDFLQTSAAALDRAAGPPGLRLN